MTSSRRIALLIEYDGTDFVGWQVQENGRAVQAVIESAIKESFRHTARIVGAGRTDSGVHARGQVAHFDLRHSLDGGKVRDALNSRLPPDCQIIASRAVPEDFHARRDAKMKVYSFRLSDGGRRRPIERRITSVVPYKLDAAIMHHAAQAWIGKHDFSAFRAAKCQAESPVRSITSIDVRRIDEVIHFSFEARSFLHHQVRNMVGTLIEIGRGAEPPEWAARILEGKVRADAGPTVPPEGLCLERISYKDEIFR